MAGHCLVGRRGWRWGPCPSSVTPGFCIAHRVSTGSHQRYQHALAIGGYCTLVLHGLVWCMGMELGLGHAPVIWLGTGSSAKCPQMLPQLDRCLGRAQECLRLGLATEVSGRVGSQKTLGCFSGQLGLGRNLSQTCDELGQGWGLAELSGWTDLARCPGGFSVRGLGTLSRWTQLR